MTGTAPRSRITWTNVSASYPLSAITYFMGSDRSSASAWVISWAWPAVSLNWSGVAQGVHAHVDFTGEATATSAQALRPLAPFLAARRPHRDGPGSWCCPAEGVPGQDHWQRPLASASRRLAHTSGESVYTRCSIGHTPAGAPATGHRSGISTRSP